MTQGSPSPKAVYPPTYTIRKRCSCRLCTTSSSNGSVSRLARVTFKATLCITPFSASSSSPHERSASPPLLWHPSRSTSSNSLWHVQTPMSISSWRKFLLSLISTKKHGASLPLVASKACLLKHTLEILNIFSPHGFLYPDNVNKPGAIASLWCFCGIFYCTRFSFEHPQSLFFPNYPTWESLHAQLSQKSSIQSYNQGKDHYFCNCHAYGQATQRSISSAPAYIAHEPSWLELFCGKEPDWRIPYKDAYLFTQCSKCKDSKQARLLPQIGPLTGMLITVDLVYAGKVAMPSAEQMGEMVHSLDKGADTYLQHFLLLHKQSLLEDTQAVFRNLYNMVVPEVL
ncbi:hypothetical protein BD413DRAFT_496118 [Trametes elegans]|nr:hypothetical protein BD413DRAFT_496118 [Trametes elegans]